MGTVRLVVADDHVLMRAGIARVFETADEFEVVGSCADRDELLALVDGVRPDVVLTDIRMPPTRSDEGIQAALSLAESHPDVGVVVLSQYVSAAYAIALFERGSRGRGYLLKDHVADEGYLFTAVRSVATGGSYIDPVVVDTMFAARRGRPDQAIDRLTPRELDVLERVASGLSNAAIAAALHIGERAVEKHINAIFTKLDLPSEDAATHRRVRAALVYLDARDGA